MRVTWRKQPYSSGLASMGEGPRGAILKVDGRDVGHVCANRLGMKYEWRGWYWCAWGEGIPIKNTAADHVFYDDLEVAKSACKAYVVKCLSGRDKKGVS